MENFSIKPGQFLSSQLEKDITEKLTKRNFTVIRHVEKFAEGITGYNFYIYVFINDGTGWNTKKDCKKFVVDNQLKKKYKSTKPNKKLDEYGFQGTNTYTFKYLSGKQLIEFINEQYTPHGVRFIEL